MRFVLIIGPPRTGTSLMVDLVRKCGYEFGDVTKPKDSRPHMGLRSPRNEHNLTKTGLKEPKNPKNVFKEFKHRGINANKIVNAFHLWLPHFAKQYDDLRIICMRRDIEAGLRGVAEISGRSKEWRRNFYMERRKWVQEVVDSEDYNSLLVDFEMLLKKDNKLLRSLVGFVGSDVDIEELKAIIKPDVSKNG